MTKTQDGKYTYWQFQSGGYDFNVLWSPTGYFTVMREPRGHQLKTWGKTFWKPLDMIAHYRTAAVQLSLIAAEVAAA